MILSPYYRAEEPALTENTALTVVPRPSAARVWWLASRPATLAASVSPVLVATAIGYHLHAHRPWETIGALVVAVAMQIGVNFSNDYSDFRNGADTEARVGPLRAASSGVIPPRQVQIAGFAAFALAAAAGVAISLTTDWRLLIVGVLAVAAGYFYTGGPRPYGYLGLGELFVFLFFGLFATVGTVYVTTLQLPLSAWLLGGSCGFLASAVLSINNLRDIETDRVAGKHTLAVRLGRRATIGMVAGFYGAALLLCVLAARFGGLPALSVIALAVAPFAVAMMTTLGSLSARTLVGALKRAAELEVWFALLFTFGVVFGTP
jgi:1,4-dihydroxy-2-naphthoate polyprenyltransferase